MLIYATTVMSLGWYPWNVLMLVPLFGSRRPPLNVPTVADMDLGAEPR
jgi:hypothetical protein